MRLFAEDVGAGATLPVLMATMAAVDAYWQMLTHPVLDVNLANEDTSSKAGTGSLRGRRRFSTCGTREISGENVHPFLILGRGESRRKLAP